MAKQDIPRTTPAERLTGQAIAVRTNYGQKCMLYNVEEHASYETIVEGVHNWDPNVRTILVDVTRLKT